jgi:hypothetical protein
MDFDNSDYLRLVRKAEAELDALKRDREQRRERDQQEQERCRQERQEEAEAAQYTAASWPEALRKQRDRCKEEAELWKVDCPDQADDTFGPAVGACGRALELWREEAVKIQARLSALYAQIEALKATVPASVASRLQAEAFDRTSGGRWIVDALAEDTDLETFLTW